MCRVQHSRILSYFPIEKHSIWVLTVDILWWWSPVAMMLYLPKMLTLGTWRPSRFLRNQILHLLDIKIDGISQQGARHAWMGLYCLPKWKKCAYGPSVSPFSGVYVRSESREI